MPDWRKHLDAALENEDLDPARVAEVREELSQHLEDRYYALLAEGLAPAEAERKALAELTQGALAAELRNVLRRAPQDFEHEPASFWSSLGRDMRYGFRQLRLSPGFAIAALLSLALGIGANTAIFELLDAVRMRTLPVEDPQQLVAVKINAPKGRTGAFRAVGDLTLNLFNSLRAQQQVFSELSAWSYGSADLSRSGEARYGRVFYAGGDLFQTLGLGATVGRLITPADDQKGCQAPPAVLSYGYWQREMGGRLDVVGTQVWVNRHPFEVVGVTPPDFFGLEVGRKFEVAVPLCAEQIVDGDGAVYNLARGWWLGAIGRLKPNVTLEQASAQLAAISPSLMQATTPPEYSTAQRAAYAADTLRAEESGTGYSRLRRQYDRPLWMLLSISALVLLIACANLANLMLARATAREREMAVRIALGASRGRLLRQLLSESLLLAILGASGGAALAHLLSRLLVPFLGSRDADLFIDLHMDWRVLGFTAGLAMITCLLFGLWPALQSSRVAPGEAMKAGGRGVVAARTRFGFRRALVAIQMALSLTLVVGALLFVRTFRNLLAVNPGFNADRIYAIDADFQPLNVPEARRLAFKEELTRAVAQVPGVDAVARARFEPVNGGAWNEQIDIPASGTTKAESWFNAVSPGFFATIGSPILAGREFNAEDRNAQPKAAIITRTFARKLFHDPAPLGKTFGVVQYGDKPDALYQVVGVAEDIRYEGVRSDAAPVAYVADESKGEGSTSGTDTLMMVRSGQPPEALYPALRNALLKVNPDLILLFVRMKDDIADSLVTERLMAMLAGFFGLLAIVLAVVGLYGVIAYMVARRTNEIGIRMALGAKRRTILALIMKEVAAICGFGLIAGVGLALVAAPAARSLLFGLKASDPATFALAIAGLGIVALLASLGPAMRAARLEPMIALHDE